MGKKGGNSPPPQQVVAPPPPEFNIEAMLGPLMHSMATMQQNFANQMSQMMQGMMQMNANIPQPTEVERRDWGKLRDDLQKKYNNEGEQEAKKIKGRTSTQLVSPLLDDEELDTIKINLTGGG